VNRVEVAVHRFRESFNSQRFYEAHDVLEEIWLPSRGSGKADLWKGLIQLAGAFVHVQKGRPEPALRLLRSSRQLLEPFDSAKSWIDLGQAIEITREWETKISGWVRGPQCLPDLLREDKPRLDLVHPAPPGGPFFS